MIQTMQGFLVDRLSPFLDKLVHSVLEDYFTSFTDQAKEELAILSLSGRVDQTL